MTIDNKKYELPTYPEAEPKWRAIPRRSRMIPFGYEVSPTDPDILLPIPEELELLEQAKGHTKNYSYRVVSEWLSEASGRYISHMGLQKRLEYERQNKYKANGYLAVAKRLQKTLQKLREIEEDRVGSRTTDSRARRFEEFDPSGTEGSGD